MNQQLKQHRTYINKQLAEYGHVERLVEDHRIQYVQAENELTLTEEARVIIQEVSQALQQQAHDKIAKVVSDCLIYIFSDDAYQFKINFVMKRGRTEAVLQFHREGLVLDNPMEQAGIGQVEVAAFALRLASILLQRPPVRKLLVLDEPFKSIRGKHYKKRVRGLLLMLAERYGVQLILCADVEAYPELMLGSVVEVE